jgi:glycosyltransferase involved in cell wall biosynthesis
MRILMLSPYIPWPLTGGPTIRIYYVLRELVRLGHEVVLLAGHDGPPLPASHPLNSLCREIVTYTPPLRARPTLAFFSALRSMVSPLPYVAAKFGARQIQRGVQCAAEKGEFDLIWANFAFMVDALPPDLAAGSLVVLDEHESEGLLWRQFLRHGSLPKRLFAVINLVKLRRFRERVMSKADVVLCNSEREAQFTRRLFRQGKAVWAVPNGVDAELFAPVFSNDKGNSILLCGGLAVYRNRQAAVWFARKVFPRIRREVPDAKLWIVGSHPGQDVCRLAQYPGIHVAGTVDDVRGYYAQAKVAVAPYRYGEGTRIKVVEALACGTPLVSTAVGCQGLDVKDDEHVLIAETETDFCNGVVGLLRDAGRARRLAAAGRELVEEKYTWKGLIGNLEPKLIELAERKCPDARRRLPLQAE